MVGKILHGPPLNPAPDVTLGQFFFDRATKFAHRTCHIDGFTGRHETFATLKQKSTRVALKLREKGVSCEDVVVVCSTPTLDTPVPILGTLFLGAKVANLDPTLSLQQTKHLLTLVTPKVIFVEEGSVSLIQDSLHGTTPMPEIVIFGENFLDFLEPQPKEEQFRPVAGDREDTAVMFFSSGTTGLPKAICHSSRSFLNILHSFFQRGGNFDTTLSFTSFYWISGMQFLGCSFISGGRRVVCGTVVDPERTFQLIQKYQVTYMFLAPVLTFKLTNFPNWEKYDTSSLHSILTGGTAISIEQYRKVSSIFQHSTLVFGYGQTETDGLSIFHPDADKELILRNVGSCGRVAPSVTLKIVDPETNETLGPNQKGEIRVKTPSVMKGYYRADSSGVFDRDGFLKTGDVGYYDEDECLYCVGRLKEMFKYMSWHIVPSAIEAVLHQHPGVEEAVVFGFPRSEEEGEVPAAAVVLKSGARSTEEEIQSFVDGRVSDREKLRGGVYLVETLARTPTGKVMRMEVRRAIVEKN